MNITTAKIAPSRLAEVAAYRAADERIAAAWDVYHEAYAPIRAAEKEIRENERRRRYYAGRTAATGQDECYVKRIATLEAKLEELRPIALAAREAAVALDRELYTGWPRFYFVQHIHNSQHCSSFRPTTRILWMPEVSGLTEAEAVEAGGETLCTKCYPTAPVELTTPRVAEGICAGSGQAINREVLTGREDAYYSPTGTCRVCAQTVGLTARHSGKVRKHKAA